MELEDLQGADARCQNGPPRPLSKKNHQGHGLHSDLQEPIRHPGGRVKYMAHRGGFGVLGTGGF